MKKKAASTALEKCWRKFARRNSGGKCGPHPCNSDGVAEHFWDAALECAAKRFPVNRHMTGEGAKTKILELKEGDD